MARTYAETVADSIRYNSQATACYGLAIAHSQALANGKAQAHGKAEAEIPKSISENGFGKTHLTRKISNLGFRQTDFWKILRVKFQGNFDFLF